MLPTSGVSYDYYKLEIKQSSKELLTYLEIAWSFKLPAIISLIFTRILIKAIRNLNTNDFITVSKNKIEINR